MSNFFQQYDQHITELAKFFKTKRTTYETAVFFDQLSLQQNSDNPFEAALAALAKFGELQCYVKLEDTAKTLQTAVSAARLFIENAKFGYEFSRALKETWENSLADGLHCYRVAIDLLKSKKKPYLASVMLLELGKTEQIFEMHHSAGNTFEEAVDTIVDGKAPLPLLFNALICTISAYTKVDRFDLALDVIERSQKHFFDNETMWESPSPIMKRQYRDLLIFQAQLLLMTFRYEDCVTFAEQNLEPEEIEIFRILCDASKGCQVFVIDGAIEKARSSKKFNNSQVALFERHLQLISKIVESGVFQAMSG